MDKNTFFWEATKRICGSLDIEAGLFELHKLLQKKMPLAMIYLQYYEPELNAMRSIATISQEEFQKQDLLVPLSKEAGYLAANTPTDIDAFLMDDPSSFPVTRELSATDSIKPSSVAILALRVDQNMLGFLAVTSEGDNRLTNEHLKMITLLKEPLSMAMSNTLKHRNELKMFNRDFFFEVTKRICGNLEIEKGLQECVSYLSKHMPADHIHLEKYDNSFSSLRLVARATSNESERLNQLIHLPEEIVKKEENFYKQGLDGSHAPVLIFNKPEDEFIFGPMIEVMGTSDFSTMILPLVIQDQIAGALVLRANGTNQYTEEHAKLFGILRDPFFVAMSNYLKHQKIIDFKNLVTDDNRYLQGELRRIHGEKIIGADFGLKEVMFKVQQVAQMGSPVLLLGETGTGKDVIANAIHYSSLRSKEPFVSVNCGAIPDTLIDSELFGHEKGAFTGALSQKRGRFERADKGTIFLDEIGELPLQAQVRLLRVLQTKEIERIGGNKTIKLDIRIIAATNRDMKQMVQEKLFREDLWFRLNVFPIEIPPLRERKCDIPALVQHFIHEKVKELKLQTIPELSPAAMDSLLLYNWPGNVRELDNIIERALILNPSGPISFDHMGFETQQDFDDSTVILDEVVANHIKKILKQTNGKINGEDGAAAILGINPNTLRNRMIKLGIEYKKNR